MTTLIADVETDGFLDEMTRIWCLAIYEVQDDEPDCLRLKPEAVDLYAHQPGYPALADGIERLRAADRVVFHNGIRFDMDAINKLYPDTIQLEQVYDTMLMSRLRNPQSKYHSLEEWGRKLEFPKGDHTDWARFSDEMASYCQLDVAITHSVYKTIEPKLRDWGYSLEVEHKTARIIHYQELNGFRLDVPKAQRLEAELRQEKQDIETRLQAVFPPVWVPVNTKGSPVKLAKRDHTAHGYVAGTERSVVELQTFNPGSNQQIEMRLRRLGWRPRKFTPSGQAQLDEDVLNDLAMVYEEAKELARYARVTKQLGQLVDGDNGWLRLVKPNGRVYGGVNTNGAVTGRMTHMRPNLANVDKKDLRMREVWIPEPGWKLVGVDAAGIEERILAHYLQPKDGGVYIHSVTQGSKEEGNDPHTTAQRLLSFFSRDNVKREKYAFFYGAGDAKLGLIAIDDAKQAGKYNPDDAPHLFSKARKALSPSAVGKDNRSKLERGIVGLEWLIASVKEKHKTQGWVRGLDGRKIITRSDHSALNTLLQGGGAIVMKVALILFHERMEEYHGTGYRYCANVHDEVQIEAAPEIAELVGQGFADAITKAGETLGVRCPLAGTADIGNNWKDTH